MTFDDEKKSREQISGMTTKWQQSSIKRSKQGDHHSKSVNQKKAHRKSKKCCGQRKR